MISSPVSSVTDMAQIWDGVGNAGDTEADVGGSVGAKSLYVQVFERMLDIVLKHEAFLFVDSELACLARLRKLSYPASYLLVRLCLCKRGKWHTIPSLEARYCREIGDQQRISSAIDELCGLTRCTEGPEVIDLTLENDDRASPPRAQSDPLSVFAADDEIAAVPQLLACLSVDELKTVAKQMKVTPKTVQSRAGLMDAILTNAAQQATLAFPVLAPRNQVASGSMRRQLTLSFSSDGRKGTQHAVVRRLVSSLVGRCVRIEPAVFALFDRVSLVFFRSTSHSPSLLLPALLAAFRKRQYGSVGCSYVRTTSIFPSREALLAYEDALLLEFRVDEALGDDGNGSPQMFVQKTLKGRQSQARGKRGETSPVESPRVEGAKVVRDIWEKVYCRWRDLISREDEQRAGLERFDCGHVLTRIVYKGAQALAILKEYDLEVNVLETLLSQTKWRRGRRGAWYDRLALVLMTHCNKTQENLEAAMDIAIRGLEDELTHTIYRPRLERRLTRLENMLKIPQEQRHKCDGQLLKADEVFVEGVRIYKHQPLSAVPNKPREKLTTASSCPEISNPPKPIAIAGASAEVEAPRGKTIWAGRHGEEVSVEQLALEFYEDMGFKGFHSEGSVVSTLFGLLFWDIIFAPVPGAFETPYQTAPLDISEDVFYSARMELIEKRLKELEDGAACEIIGRVDERERPAKTLCVGIDWNFERKDLLEIVDCLGGYALATICRMLCEDYGQWRGGVPDLFVWNATAGTCKFVEVKSPNDTLSENQKVWIDVLLGSKILVDLCHVTEKGAAKNPKKPRGGKRKEAPVVFDAESEDEIDEAQDENYKVVGISQKDKGPKRSYDSEGSFSPPSAKHKAEVILTPRKRRKR